MSKTPCRCGACFHYFEVDSTVKYCRKNGRRVTTDEIWNYSPDWCPLKEDTLDKKLIDYLSEKLKYHNCDTCTKQDCEHRVAPGETVRSNCFDWTDKNPYNTYVAEYVAGYHTELTLVPEKIQPLVRCRDCKWHKRPGCICGGKGDTKDDWFCSEGEKKDD